MKHIMSSSTKSKTRYTLNKIRKRYESWPVALCGSLIMFLPLIVLATYIMCHACPAQILEGGNHASSTSSDFNHIPSWIYKRSHRNLLPSTTSGLFIDSNDTSYDAVQHALIFVSIAAYRDNECVNTVYQVFENAKFPDRLRIGIFTQNNISAEVDCAEFRKVLNCDVSHDYNYLFSEDDTATTASTLKKGALKNSWTQKYRDTQHVLCGRLWQIRTDRVDWRDGLGPTYGRYRAELFFDDEEYVLQMDSHTAFVQDWDEILIRMHQQINNDYAVISTYPKPLRSASLWHWQAPAVNKRGGMYVICGTQILKDKITKSFKLRPASVVPNTQKPILTAFFAAGFSFQKGHRVRNVPYDPYAAFLFDGEEMSMAVRMWTHGYDMYAPHLDVAYHLYSPNDAKIRPVFWEHEWNVKWKVARDSEYRINYMMGLNQIFHPYVKFNKYDLREISKYGVGQQRDVQDFWTFAKIDLEKLESADLCPLYKQGGMASFRVPWKNATLDPYHAVLDS